MVKTIITVDYVEISNKIELKEVFFKKNYENIKITKYFFDNDKHCLGTTTIDYEKNGNINKKITVNKRNSTLCKIYYLL